jgi:hypothetical protein
MAYCRLWWGHLFAENRLADRLADRLVNMSPSTQVNRSAQRQQCIRQHRIRRDAFQTLVVAVTKSLAVVVG